jgi:hypothetical protein
MTDITTASRYDYRDGHVQESLYTGNYGFVSAETIVLAAQARNSDGTFPTTGLSSNVYNLDEFIPVGVVENINMAQQKNIQQLFEIGSKESYLIPGRTVIQVALNRVLLDGDSLMRVMYPVITGATGSAEFGSFDIDPPLSADDAPGTMSSDQPDLWFNLASSFLNKPANLALLFYDDEANLLGNVVLVNSLVESHNLTVAAAQTIITENVRIRVGKIAILGSGK